MKEAYPYENLAEGFMIIIGLIIFLVPAIWGYNAGAKRSVGGGMGLVLGLFLSYLGVLIVYLSPRVTVAPVQRQPSTASADELKKYKDLFDSGVITETEFNLQKQKLLGGL